MGRTAKRSRRLTLSVGAGLLAVAATTTYYLATAGTVTISVTLQKTHPGLTAHGKLASYTPFATGPSAYDPDWAPGSSKLFAVDGNALGQVTTAEGHTPYVNFAWTNPQTVAMPSTPHNYRFNPLGYCSNRGCAGWIDVAIYVPIYQGWCRTPSFNPYFPSQARDGWRSHDVITVEDPALKYNFSYKTFWTGQTKTGTNDAIFCAELDRGAIGAGATTGVVQISQHRFSSTLRPGKLTSSAQTPTTTPAMAPTFPSTVSSNTCKNATDPTTASALSTKFQFWWRSTWQSHQTTAFPWTWCTPSLTNLATTSRLRADQNVFFVVATPQFDGFWTPRNWGDASILHTLKFMVTVH
jgi:hypothetical protein